MDANQSPVVSAPAAAPTKPWWTSRTLWFNALVAVFAVLETSSGALQQAIGPTAYPVFALCVALVNAVLRMLTTQGVGK